MESKTFCRSNPNRMTSSKCFDSMELSQHCPSQASLNYHSLELNGQRNKTRNRTTAEPISATQSHSTDPPHTDSKGSAANASSRFRTTKMWWDLIGRVSDCFAMEQSIGCETISQ
jgi:hypothetical protein